MSDSVAEYCSQCFVTVCTFSETVTEIYPIYWYRNEIIFCFLLFSILVQLNIL